MSLPTQAATITVSGTCTLPDAITAANTDTATGDCLAGSGADTIRLTADITLQAALPDITSGITVDGDGHSISGDDTVRIFNHTGGQFIIGDITLEDGNAGAGSGGAIQSTSSLALHNVTLSNNTATGGNSYGGAIFSSNHLSIISSVLENNTLEGLNSQGGAIAWVSLSSDLRVTDVDISGNQARSGAGIYAVSGGDVIIRESRISGNTAVGKGGGIYNVVTGTTVIEDSAIYGNISLDTAGIYRQGGNFTIQNSTIYNNASSGLNNIGALENNGGTSISLIHVTIANNGSGLNSAALVTTSGSGSVAVKNSIIYGNAPRDCQNASLAGSVNSIIGTSTSCSGGTGIITSNPLLPANPSGSPDPPYFVLPANSPAIGAGDDDVCDDIETDQRGEDRPDSGCDLGAYERVTEEEQTETPQETPMTTPTATPGTSRSQPATGRAKTKNEETVQHNEQMIDEHDYDVETKYGLQTISLRPLNPDDCGAIGSQAVCDMDVLDVVDVTGHVVQGIRFCFPQHGKVLFLPSHDANGVAINQQTAHPEILPVEHVDGMTCVTINRTGKLVLVYAEPPTIITQTQQEPEPVWEPVPVTQCGHRTQADGSVVHVVQSGHHCWAIAEACGIYVEDIQQLNPEFGDCRMLHPGDELVVSVPPSPTDGVSLSVEEIPYYDPEYMAMEARVLWGVARCWGGSGGRGYGDSQHLQFARFKRMARVIAAEAWRNRGSDHWTAGLGEGRLVAIRTSPQYSFGEIPLQLAQVVCTQMFPYFQRNYPAIVPEPSEVTLEELRHAIVDMLHACDRYAVAEREAEKIARAALRDGVRRIDQLPAYRAYNYRSEAPDPRVGAFEAFETDCFTLPDDSYLEDWGEHGDKDQLYNERQIEEAEAKLEAIKEWAVVACDIATTAGASGAIKVGTTGVKKAAAVVVEHSLREIAKITFKEVAATGIEATAGDNASQRRKIATDFLANVTRILPTGPCSAVMAASEFDELVKEMQEALENLEEGQGVEDLDVFGEDIHCEIYSIDTVLAKRDPDPNKDASELRLDASDAFSPLATVEHDGEKYYVVLGTRGRGTRVVGGVATAAVYNKPENHGHAFVPASAINATDSCNDLPDVTHLYTGAARPQDMIGRELVNLNIQEVPDAFAKEDCKFSMDIDPDRLHATDLLYIEPESMSTAFSVFRLCETHEGTACNPVSEDNEFVITHYDIRNRRVYVKSLDDDGKPEGWLMSQNLSQSFIRGRFGGRRSHGLSRITNHWVDPDQFNPENVTDGSSAYGNTAMCLPQESS